MGKRKKKKKKKKKWSKVFIIKSRRGALREKFKEEKAFHLWRRLSQTLGNKKAKLNKVKCRIKVQADE